MNRDEADATAGRYIILCLGAEHQRQLQRKRPRVELQSKTRIEYEKKIDNFL